MLAFKVIILACVGGLASIYDLSTVRIMGLISCKSLVLSLTAVLNFSNECLTILPVSAFILCRKLLGFTKGNDVLLLLFDE